LSGKNMFDLLWERMDELVAWYYSEDPKMPYELYEVDQAKGEMKGLAFAIKVLYRRSQWWGYDLFQDQTEISRHAKARHDAKKTGQPLPDTPGCHGMTGIITPTPEQLKAKTRKPTQPRRRVVLPTAPQVSPETEKQIRNGLNAGFPVDQLAQIYKVSVQVVESYR
jgi:hypothetical protein